MIDVQNNKSRRRRAVSGAAARGAMIDLHYAPTPNGWKISIMLEELGLPYTVMSVNIRAGEQFRPEFLAVSPNNRPRSAPAAGAGGTGDREIRRGTVRRGGAEEYVRATSEGAGEGKIAIRHSGAREARARNP
jgi:Glutathione S-transferase, N-terminal domain